MILFGLVAAVNGPGYRIGTDFKQAIAPMFRGTIIGSLCSLIPGRGPTIASFIAYATEKKVSKTPERFGTGMIEGVVCPEAATHSSVQGDFIPTMSLGIPGDAVMRHAPSASGRYE
jgi:putative tricarboxylic transport membrane protein